MKCELIMTETVDCCTKVKVYIPKYRILFDNSKTNNILYFQKKTNISVIIEDEPYWKYHVIDELEQFQIFPKKISYNNEFILERIIINYDKGCVIYKII